MAFCFYRRYNQKRTEQNNVPVLSVGQTHGAYWPYAGLAPTAPDVEMEILIPADGPSTAEEVTRQKEEEMTQERREEEETALKRREEEATTRREQQENVARDDATLA